MSKRDYDIGLVVPLKEEFQYVTEIAPVVERHPFEGTFFYELRCDGVTLVACIVGEMGPLPAAHATTRLLSFANVRLVVVIGVAGSLDKDVLLGDVVVADEVNEYLAKSKAVEAGDGYEFMFSGRHSRTDYVLRETVNHFDLAGGECLSSWHSAAKTDYDDLGTSVDKTLCKSPPKLHVGPIASGDIVGSAKAFTAQLLSIDRKFLALDMEAAGVVKAASDRLIPVRVLAVRGISDFADERKEDLDAQGAGAWRRLSVRNATHLVTSLLAWSEFRSCVGIGQGTTASIEALEPRLIIQHVSEHQGGAWLVGVVFGLHSHAPVVTESGDVTSADIGRARLTHTGLDELMKTVEGIQSAVNEGGISHAEVGQQVASAIAVYRDSLSEAGRDLLGDFDEVVQTVLSAADGESDDELDEAHQQVEAMIDDERFEEAEQVLSGMNARDCRVRELLADVHFSRGHHDQVQALLGACNAESLSRRELEHLISSCSELSQFEVARTLLQLHSTAFADRAGMMFQAQIKKRYPGELKAEKQE